MLFCCPKYQILIRSQPSNHKFLEGRSKAWPRDPKIRVGTNRVKRHSHREEVLPVLISIMSNIELPKQTWNLHTILRKLNLLSRLRDRFRTLKSKGTTLSSVSSSIQGRKSFFPKTDNYHQLTRIIDGHKHCRWSYRLWRPGFCLTTLNCHPRPKRSNSQRISNSTLRGALYSSLLIILNQVLASQSFCNI